MYLPVIGRLSLVEWPLVVASFLAVYLEFVISLITRAIPDSVLDLVTSFIQQVHSTIVPEKIKNGHILETAAKKITKDIRKAPSIQHIGHLFGYQIDDHIVPTADGYLLCLHRIRPLKEGAPVVYLHHGLLMCSDIWVVNIKKERNLPFILHDMGFDVWMGNNRGNKYSTKHLSLKPSHKRFWDFSIDEFAMYDIPDSINYILSYTKQQDLTYIGFSQGSAQAFAALSLHDKLNTQIKLFIALAPAMTPSGLHNQFVDTLMKSTPNFMYLAFGKRLLLPTASFWKNICYPPLFSKIIDLSVRMLFDWKNYNITHDQKIAAFSHLYSPTSVKSVVHWFQIIRNGAFQLFDEDVSLTNALSAPFRNASFPTQTNIKVPIKLIYGSIDSLVDIDKMLSLLPADITDAVAIPNHEHLDIIWGDHIEKLVFPHLFNFLGVDKDTEEENEKVTALESS
ncbi:Sterol esterase TGL1 [Cyberlindnera fabianii]|uniref:Sterol esterase TGL1 n=1 Tax=Cyberlindnera fabianii TaxID=36022 RepID=A0A1V2L787_CYBFA|nr:Sterol esterase TGL1 [Cyberlindnera fabianii]